MLVLSRKQNESILIGNDIKIVVTKIEGDRVRLAIKCPKAIPVFRSEVLLKLDKDESDPQENVSPNM